MLLAIICGSTAYLNPIKHPAACSVHNPTALTATTDLYAPQQRENAAQYLLDLHDSKATVDFCSGMLFQLQLSDALYNHLKHAKKELIVHGPDTMRMFKIPGYVATRYLCRSEACRYRSFI